MFVEEPTHPENVDALLEITRSTSIPIATGERNTTRWGFREICEKKAAAVLQPDIRHCGGILEMRRIAAYAEVHYIALAPHSAADAVGVAASLQAMAATPQLPDPGVRRRHRRGAVHRAPALRGRIRGSARGTRSRDRDRPGGPGGPPAHRLVPARHAPVAGGRFGVGLLVDGSEPAPAFDVLAATTTDKPFRKPATAVSDHGTARVALLRV